MLLSSSSVLLWWLLRLVAPWRRWRRRWRAWGILGLGCADLLEIVFGRCLVPLEAPLLHETHTCTFSGLGPALGDRLATPISNALPGNQALSLVGPLRIVSLGLRLLGLSRSLRFLHLGSSRESLRVLLSSPDRRVFLASAWGQLRPIQEVPVSHVRVSFPSVIWSRRYEDVGVDDVRWGRRYAGSVRRGRWRMLIAT